MDNCSNLKSADTMFSFRHSLNHPQPSDAYLNTEFKNLQIQIPFCMCNIVDNKLFYYLEKKYRKRFSRSSAVGNSELLNASAVKLNKQ